MSARYDKRHHRIFVELSSGQAVMFRPQMVQGLQGAEPSQLEEIEITTSGFGLHFPRLDTEVHVSGLLDGQFGSRRWTAV